MSTPLETVMTMSEEELEVLNKNLKKQMMKKFVINVATGVVVHVAAKFIIGVIDRKTNGSTPELTE